MLIRKIQDIFIIFSLLSILSSCNSRNEDVISLQNLTQYVNPLIGTGGHGHVFLGANVPYGLVQLGPTQFSQGWDWCSGYHYSDSTIIGFSHQHLSGTGIGDLGDIMFMPVVGNVRTTRGMLPDPQTGIYSYFTHNTEIAKPGYYSVLLERFGINVELTATNRVGFHKYTFPKSDDARIIINMEHGTGWDAPVEGFLQQENDSVVSGYRKSSGWAKSQEIYFTAVFSKPMKSFIVSDSIFQKEGSSIIARKAYGQALFETDKGEEVLVKAALSPVSIENAKMNMQEELLGWDFQRTTANADKTWNEELNKIILESNGICNKRIFYSSLYHAMFFPCTYNDVNGDYRGADGKVYNDSTYTNLTVLSLWDAYRAAFPLMTIINPDITRNLGNTMVNIYKQQGKLPVWHLMGNETDCMVGNPGVCIMADLLLKGIDIDKKAAYEAMKVSTMLDGRGMNWLKGYGYIPCDKETSYESVAKGLEFAIADWSLAQVAKKTENKEDYNYFINRSKSYRHYFDKDLKFMRGISSEGKFREPFNPFRSIHMKDDYTEGNAWQYAWLVPQDVYGLIDLFGGQEHFVNKLDSLFIVKGDIGEHANDITGLIGQYAHGNEPGHHIAYLYPYVGQPWKTAEKVREILSDFYHNQPDGICGNEDVGQMSAWYILSSLGMYQVKPAGGEYIFGSPIIDEAILNIGNNKKFIIKAINNSKENKYIQSVRLNGRSYSKTYIKHTDITAGGILEFEMGKTPSKVYGIDTKNRPER
ncbi:MAG: GH92 family glycosyl hydrolase [Tannerellaceae bacterium]|jgi:predicted alpha-1,2-mannosidase|nr:GH92 family glycosyl hydrolase [Tannerellaceae bacterium]